MMDQSVFISPTRQLKLQARKQRNSSIVTDPYLISKYQQLNQQGNSQQVSDASKQLYLNSIKEENKILLNLIKEMQDLKAILLVRIRDAEVSRDLAASVSATVSSDILDIYLNQDCPLAETNRNDLQLSNDQLQLSKEIYDRMSGIAAKFRLNQLNLSDFIQNKFHSIVDAFLNENADESLSSMMKLEMIVQLNPRSIVGAEELSNSMEKAVLGQTAERITKLLKDEVQKRQKISSADQENKLSQSQQDNSNTQQLTQQNEQLRQTIIDLREKIAMLKGGGHPGAVKKGPGGSSESMKKRSGCLSDIQDSSPSATAAIFGSTNDSSNSYQQTGESKLGSDLKQVDLDQLMHDIQGLEQQSNGEEEKNLKLLSRQLGDLPLIWQQILREKFVNYVDAFILTHPLASALSSEGMQLVEEEIVQDLLESNISTYFIFLQSLEQEHSELKQILDNLDQIEDDEIRNDPTTRQFIGDSVSQMLELASVHRDLQSISTMYFSYLRDRLELKENNKNSNKQGRGANPAISMPPSSPSNYANGRPAMQRSTSNFVAPSPMRSPTAAIGGTNNNTFGNNYNNDGRPDSSIASNSAGTFNTYGMSNPSNIAFHNAASSSYNTYGNRGGAEEIMPASLMQQKSSPAQNLPRYMMPKGKGKATSNVSPNIKL